MTRDEQVYSDAHKFNPDRFLKQNGPETDPKDFVFGFGRRQAAFRFCLRNLNFRPRVCPGKAFADANVWIAAACIIAAFHAPVSRNERGEKVVPPAQFTSGFVRCVALRISRPLILTERIIDTQYPSRVI
jgi:cytochrome P450